MPTSLPSRPDLVWLKKRSKDRLAELRLERPTARLAEAQLDVAREHGFASWRALRAHVVSLSATRSASLDLPEELVARFLSRVGNGDRAAVESMLADQPALINAVGPHPFWGGRPQPLHVAIDAGREDMVELLVRAGADINGANDAYGGWSPLLIAIYKNRVGARKLLCARGARLGLVEALALGDDSAVERMLAGGATALPERTPSGASLLAFARTTAAIDRLLELGVPPDQVDQFGGTPIESLSRLGSRGKSLVRHLRARGVAAGPAILARVGDRKTLARLIDDDGAVASDPAVISAAVDRGHRDLVAWLIDRGADAGARDENGATCLHKAAWNGDLAVVELLLERGADPRARDGEHDNTPAGWAEVAAGVTNNARCVEVATRLREAEAG